MSLAALLLNYGYIAVFLGTFLEGETILIMAGFAAHRGYLDLRWVMAVATVGSFLGDQLYFYLGARYGWRILDRFPKLKPRAVRVQALLERYHLPLIPGIRFLYGLRMVGPLVIGMSSVNWTRFFALNLLGATVWAVLVGGSGYLFGNAMELVLADLRHYEEALLALMAMGGIIIWLSYHWRHR
ncbi:MAG: DedA family protein [Gallionellaceae bacterium]|nr:DedA family protein [Gallionellaceae bacterium]